jgi:hypothetical protein
MSTTIPYSIAPATAGSGNGRVTVSGTEAMMLNYVAQTDNILHQVAAEKYQANTAITSGLITIA